MFLAFSCQADAKARQYQLVYPVEIICKVEERLAVHQSSKSINEPPSCQRISYTYQENLFFKFKTHYRYVNTIVFHVHARTTEGHKAGDGSNKLCILPEQKSTLSLTISL